jgi:hypothetical protein
MLSLGGPDAVAAHASALELAQGKYSALAARRMQAPKRLFPEIPMY